MQQESLDQQQETKCCAWSTFIWITSAAIYVRDYRGLRQRLQSCSMHRVNLNLSLQAGCTPPKDFVTTEMCEAEVGGGFMPDKGVSLLIETMIVFSLILSSYYRGSIHLHMMAYWWLPTASESQDSLTFAMENSEYAQNECATDKALH